MGFFLKKLLSLWLQPLPLGLLLLAFGLWRSRRARARGADAHVSGWWLAVAGTTVIYLAATAPVAFTLLAPLEAGMSGYERLDDTPITAVVALGAGYHPVVGRPLTGQVSGASVVRVTEAVRILRLHPEARLHCTGWGDGQPGSNAAAACAIAVALGVEVSRTVAHPTPRDTEEEAQVIARSVGEGRVIVVTHAAHMPRALGLFKRYGVRAIAAPTGHTNPAQMPRSLTPNAQALGTTSGALHEWLGRLWLWLKMNLARS